MYVLTLWGKPLANSERLECLNEKMAEWTPAEQRYMVIFTDVPVLT